MMAGSRRREPPRSITLQVMTPSLRPYTLADRAACLAVFDSNTPHAFAASERADYAQFLQDPGDHGIYRVLLLEDVVVGCGGIWLDEQASPPQAGLSWGMVRHDLHGQGLGYWLLQSRLRLIRQHYLDVQVVRIDTSQHTEPYFRRQGFVTTGRRPDGFAPGLDEIRMVLRLLPVTAADHVSG
jgi:predicted GNAT family N-acyltransferase